MNSFNRRKFEIKVGMDDFLGKYSGLSKLTQEDIEKLSRPIWKEEIEN